jgi:cyanophycinase
MTCYTRILFVAGLTLIQLSVSAQTRGPEKGALYIHGGGQLNLAEFVELVKFQTGKARPTIQVMTTPQGPRRAGQIKNGNVFRLVATLRERFGLSDAMELFTLSRDAADDPKFFAPIETADAVFMSGGNQCFLTDTFAGTETLAALRRLLDRGGVIGGSSAGAQVQSSFMTRGDYGRREILGDGEHQEGFGFVTGAAFDVHVEERGRERDLFSVFSARPAQLQDQRIDPQKLLGVGIDQGVAITVIGNQIRVTGRGLVRIFDPLLWTDGQAPFYLELSAGDAFDLATRKRVDAAAEVSAR